MSAKVCMRVWVRARVHAATLYWDLSSRCLILIHCMQGLTMTDRIEILDTVVFHAHVHDENGEWYSLLPGWTFQT